ISAALRQRGIRARVATATDIVEMERRLAGPGLDPGNRRWRSVRGETGWLTTYGYRPADITADKLAQAWSMQVDGIVQNVTVFPGGTVMATLTVRTAQPPSAPPGVLLQPLPGEQALSLAATLCCPLPELRGVSPGALPETLSVPIGPSGVLLGKVGAGNRLMLPLDDPAEFSRVHVAAEDYLAKRIVVRLAGSGERVTVHTRDPQRWASVRMPDVVVTGAARPAAGTTVSVADGTCTPAPRPGTLISVGAPAAAQPRAVDVLLAQTGPATLEVTTSAQVHSVEVELFRAENRYLSAEALASATPAEIGAPS
ncbi:MAG TPA: type VII secretion protein EccE, partial [Mycobacterium sp.]